MDLSNAEAIDSFILLSILNEKLRIECDSLEELIQTYEMDASHVIDKLNVVGYQYDPLTNQFKPK
jgi:predicted nucleotidyltransferase